MKRCVENTKAKTKQSIRKIDNQPEPLNDYIQILYLVQIDRVVEHSIVQNKQSKLLKSRIYKYLYVLYP